MKILVGCEESGIVRDAFIAQGHNAYSNDVKYREHPNHITGDVKSAIRSRVWDIIILHPQCTALAVSGNATYAVNKWEDRQLAIGWTIDLWETAVANARIGVCLENPRSVIFQYLAGVTQWVNPYMFGYMEQKMTGLMLHKLPMLVETDNVREQMMLLLPRHMREKSFYMGENKKGNRAELRSKTNLGMAKAMAEQWGTLA